MASIPDVPWKRAQRQQRARRSEEQAAKLGGGKRQPASGSRWFAKGDVRANGFLLEDKFTDAESFSITKTMILKTIKEALQTPPGLLPSWRISIKGCPRLRLYREEDALYLEAKAGANE